MKSWQPHHRLILFLLLALILACVISPIQSLGADWFMTQWPALMPKRIPFHRTFNRAFMIAGVILFFLFRRQLFTHELKGLFDGGRAAASRDLATGLALSLASMVLIMTAMTTAEVHTPAFDFSAAQALARAASSAATGMFAGVFEEIFFRGILFIGLRRQAYDLRAYLLANLFYSALHFVKPGKAYFLDTLDLGAGFRHLAHTFTPFLDPPSMLPGFIGLLLVGAVLSLAVERTGKLYLAIGLHAGWVFSLKMIGLFGNIDRSQLGWLFGTSHPKLVSGVATWVAILLTGAAVHYLTRNRAVQSIDRPLAITA